MFSIQSIVCSFFELSNPPECLARYIYAEWGFDIVRFTFPVWVENLLKPGALGCFVGDIVTYQIQLPKMEVLTHTLVDIYIYMQYIIPQ